MSSILDEAHNAVHVDRRKDYDHPLDSFTRLAALWTAMNLDILKEGSSFTAERANLMLEGFKLSRELAKPKRDNRVDGAGYWETLQMIIDEREKRGVDKSSCEKC